MTKQSIDDARLARVRQALVVVLALTAVQLVFVLLDLFRPRFDDPGSDQPWLGLFREGLSAQLRATVIVLLASWPIAFAVWVAGTIRARSAPVVAERAPRQRWVHLVVIAVLLAPYVVVSVLTFGRSGGALFAALALSAAALVLVARMQRFRRMPVVLPLAAAVWGCFVASGFSGLVVGWLQDFFPHYWYSGNISLATAQEEPAYDYGRFVALMLDYPVIEELAKGAGILILALLFRRYVDGPVAGIVLGAATGLGFNLNETLNYAYVQTDEQVTFQLWTRQGLGLMAAHLAFSAVVGAAIGISRLQRSRGRAVAVVAAGYTAAVACHYASNVVIAYLGAPTTSWLPPGEWAYALVVLPAFFVVVQGPLVVVYLLVLRRGLRSEAGALSGALRAEARAGYGTVTDAEVAVLLSPSRRFRRRWLTFRRSGLSAAWALGRLYRAQLELAAARHHRTLRPVDPLAPSLTSLRESVIGQKDRLYPAPTAPRPVTAAAR